MKLTLLLFASLVSAFAQYSVQNDNGIVRLVDGKAETVVSIMPTHGNNAFRMTVRGHDILRYPYKSDEEFRTQDTFAGIPFLWPWANRLDDTAFYANGKKYALNMDLGVVRGQPGSHPMHGFLTTATQWQIVEAKADASSAWIISKLDFYKQPNWMAEFPFAHTVEMTYRLKDGALEMSVKVDNLSTDPMPLSIGFHPYFQLTDSPRDEWTFGIAAKTNWVLAPDKIPTGVTRPIEEFLPKPQGSTLKGLNLDDVFSDLVRDPSGKATMWVQGKSQRLDVTFGPKFRSVVVYSPGGAGNDYICFEPMAGITDSMNLAQKGLYRELQYVAPGQSWQEGFSIKPSGF